MSNAPQNAGKYSRLQNLKQGQDQLDCVNVYRNFYIGYMHRSRKFHQRGSNSDSASSFFVVDEGIDDQNTTKSRAIIVSPAKRHLNGVSLAGRWRPINECWLGSFVIFQGIRTSIAKKPYIFVIFQGGLDPYSPLDPRMGYFIHICQEIIAIAIGHSVPILNNLMKLTITLPASVVC